MIRSASIARRLPSRVALVSILLAATSAACADVRWAASQAGTAGILRSGEIRMDVSAALVGLVASNGAVRLYPGFVGDLPNRAPEAGEVRVARAVGIPTSFPADWILRAATDPDGDRLRVLSVSAESQRGGGAEFYAGWVVFEPAEGDSATDFLAVRIVDAYGDAVEAAIRVLPDGGPEPDPQGRGIPPRFDGDGRLRLRFAGVPGLTHRIQAATSLEGPGDPAWTDVAQVAADPQGVVTYVETRLDAAPVRFYRAVSP